MSTTTHFEISLTPPPEKGARRAVILKAVQALTFVQRVPGDAARLLYYNPDTTVHFELILGDQIVSVVSGSGFDPLDLTAGPGHSGRARVHDHRGEWDEDSADDEVDDDNPDSNYPDRSESDDDPYDDGDLAYDDDDDDTEDRPEAAITAPVTLRLPLFRPTFFLAEAIHILEGLATETELQISRPGADEDGQLVPSSKSELLAGWRHDNLAALASLGDGARLVAWSEERCRQFYDYAVSLRQLEQEFADDGIEVLPAQPAAREDTITTLCVWRCDVPAVLPQTEFVLLRRPRKRRFLLPTRFDELVVEWNELEKVLRPHAEYRTEPAPLFIVRTGTRDSAQLEKDLNGLRGEAPASTRRTELRGVVDFATPEAT
jgi:hypothetical protein